MEQSAISSSPFGVGLFVTYAAKWRGRDSYLRVRIALGNFKIVNEGLHNGLNFMFFLPKTMQALQKIIHAFFLIRNRLTRNLELGILK